MKLTHWEAEQIGSPCAQRSLPSVACPPAVAPSPSVASPLRSIWLASVVDTLCPAIVFQLQTHVWYTQLREQRAGRNLCIPPALQTASTPIRERRNLASEAEHKRKRCSSSIRALHLPASAALSRSTTPQLFRDPAGTPDCLDMLSHPDREERQHLLPSSSESPPSYSMMLWAA
eukprot:877637-Rhodomonas_salina.3